MFGSKASIPFLAAAVIGAPAVAQSWSFTRIVEEGEPLPFGTGSFRELWQPCLRDGAVVFHNADQDAAPQQIEGLYSTVNGALARVVDLGVFVPESGTQFSFFNYWPVLDESRVFLQGFSEQPEGNVAGFYRVHNSIIIKLVETGDPIPGGEGTFGYIDTSPVNVTDGGFAFYGSGEDDQEGIYVFRDGALSKIVDRDDDLPGGIGLLSQFTEPVMNADGDIVFLALDVDLNEWGVYRYHHDSGAFSVIADQSTVVPGGMGGTFSGFAEPWIDGDDVIFVGSEGTIPNAVSGIYASFDGGPLEAIAVEGAPIVSGGSLLHYGHLQESVCLENGSVLFTAYQSDMTSGIYMQIDGALTRVVGGGDVLDGKTVAFVASSKLGREGTSVAFAVSFDDDTQAIYLAELDAACPADLDGSGAVGLSDLLAVLSAWGTPDADLDDDGTTSFSDLVIVLAAWGACS